MTKGYCCRIVATYAGWSETDENAREPLPNAAQVDDIDPESFPGRWSPRRSFPLELEPLPSVVGKTLETAGAWRAGSGDSCAGGLVIGADGACITPSLAFARAIARGHGSSPSPSDFIYALPSTAASLLTKLFGFTDYQATVAEGASSGIRALGHALDLMATGRLERALVAVLSVSSARVGVALYLEPDAIGSGARVELSIGKEPPSSAGHARQETSELAALPLVELARLLDSHRDEGSTMELPCPAGNRERWLLRVRFL